MRKAWVEPDIRDEIIDFVRDWSNSCEIKPKILIKWLKISASKYYSWLNRYGKVNEHNCFIPRDNWLEGWEKEKIINFFKNHFTEGYRRCSYMMLDRNIVAVSPSSVYRVLKKAGLLKKWNKIKNTKGEGFEQPLKPHEHWHIDIAYVNLMGTFYYLISLLDGCSRFIVHAEIRKSMKEDDVEIILQRAKEKFSNAKPRIISDNGKQFIAKDFKEFIRLSGMTHVRTSVCYPQSNGKIERWHRTIKNECIRPGTPLNHEDASRIIEEYVTYYNNERLHSSIGYITPKDKLFGREKLIFSERDKKLETAREKRKEKRQNEKKLLFLNVS